MAIDLPGPVVDLSSIVDHPRDAPVEDFEAVLNSSAPVVISSWNKKDTCTDRAPILGQQVEADGHARKVGAASAASMGGGLKQTVSLSQRNVDIQMEESSEDGEDDDVTCVTQEAKSDAFRDFVADYEMITKAADAHPEVRELAAKELKSARDTVVRALNKALSGGKNRPNSQGGMASSNVAGTEKSSQAKRKKPALERNAIKKKK